MNIRNVTPDILAAIFLALILQTKSRLIGSIGIGEIGISIYCLYCYTSIAVSNKAIPIDEHNKLATLILGYSSSILFSVTLVSHLTNTFGASFRDYLAYLLSFLLFFAFSIRRPQLQLMIFFFMATLIIIIFYQYFLGGEDAWYSMRFTAGARNPNQFALYLVCLLCLASTLRSKKTYILALTVVVFWGLKSRSDAFLVFLATYIIFYILVIITPKKFFVFLFMPIILILITLYTNYYNELFYLITNTWLTADEGGVRLQLFINGLYAWLSTPFSILIGNGAGSYSGLSGPFEGVESHNTIIDLLTIGGIFGAFVLYIPLLKSVIYSYTSNNRAVFSTAIGLLVFSLFHFVARQPIYWFTIYAFMANYSANNKRKLL